MRHELARPAVRRVDAAGVLALYLFTALPPRAEVVELLLGGGASTTGALHLTRDVRWVERLIAAGADVEERNAAGMTPLMSALAFPDGILAAARLLAAGARTDGVDAGGRGVLEHALPPSHYHDDPGDVLTQIGPAGDARLVADLDRLVLPMARAERARLERDFVKAIRRGSLSDAHRRSTLVLAIEHGLVRLSRALLDLGVTLRDPTALALAAQSARPDVVALLLARGADPNERDPGGTPLHRAVEAADIASVRLLLDAGGDPHVRARGMPSAYQAALDPQNRIGPRCVALFDARAPKRAAPMGVRTRAGKTLPGASAFTRAYLGAQPQWSIVAARAACADVVRRVHAELGGVLVADARQSPVPGGMREVTFVVQLSRQPWTLVVLGLGITGASTDGARLARKLSRIASSLFFAAHDAVEITRFETGRDVTRTSIEERTVAATARAIDAALAPTKLVVPRLSLVDDGRNRTLAVHGARVAAAAAIASS